MVYSENHCIALFSVGVGVREDNIQYNRARK